MSIKLENLENQMRWIHFQENLNLQGLLGNRKPEQKNYLIRVLQGNKISIPEKTSGTNTFYKCVTPCFQRSSNLHVIQSLPPTNMKSFTLIEIDML